MKFSFMEYHAYWFLVAMLPAAWFVGGEQFVLPVIVLLLLLFRTVCNERPLAIHSPFLIWILWLFAMIISVVMIDQDNRYLTWFRNVTVGFSGVAMAYLVRESHTRFNRIRSFLLVLLAYSTACTAAGLLGVLGLNVDYVSPAAFMLHVNDKGYLHDIFVRSFVQADAVWFAQDFIRPKGLLMYANLLSGVVLVGSSIKLYLLASRNNPLVFVALMTGLLLADGMVAVATLSRSAWIGLAMSFLSVLLLVRLGNRAKRMLLIAFLLATALAMVSGVNDVMEKRFVDKANSNEERMTNYKLIFDAVMQDPAHFLFGYGSQRDAWQIGIPVGSHSTPLGMLYKYGFVGFCFFTIGVWLTFLRVYNAIRRDREHTLLGAVLFACLVQIAVQSLFVEIDVDVVYMMIWWILVGLGLAYADIVFKKLRLQSMPLQGAATV